MKLFPLLSSLIFILSGPALAGTPAAWQDLPAYSTGYDPQRDPFADGHAALRLAQQSNRRVLIEVGGDWCKWCHVMDAFFDQNPDIRARLHETFVMLRINVSDANDNARFLQAFPKPLGYPHMYVAENDGSLLLSKDTADFLSNGAYSRERFLEFFDRWETPDTTPTAYHEND